MRRDRPGPARGGGLAFLISHGVSFSPSPTDHLFPTDTTTEHQGIVAHFDDLHLRIVNIYIPPTSSCPPNFTPELHLLLDQGQDDTLILGDFNAHHRSWHSATGSDAAAARGRLIADLVLDSTYCVLNGDSATLVPTGGESSSPDLSLAGDHLALEARWRTIQSLSSDHLPIAITLDALSPSIPLPKRTFINYKKADWQGYGDETETLISALPPPSSCADGELLFRRALLSASNHKIPRGFRRDFIPGLSAESIALINRRDDLRVTSPGSQEISELSSRISELLNEDARRSWVERVEACSLKHDSSRFWSLLRSLSGKKQSHSPNQPITFNNRTLSSKRDIAKAFCRQFTASSSGRTRASRRIRRQLNRNHPLDPAFPLFTSDQVRDAIASSGTSTAPGPDLLTIHHLRHLGPSGIAYLTELFNLSLRSANIPAIWKSATIVAIPKPGKDHTSSSSYRPISLLCPAVKVLERLLLPFLSEHLHLSSSQHGFRENRSTTSALLPLTHSIVRGFNQPLPPTRTVAMAIDFSRAFDTVPHDCLLVQVGQSSLPNNVTRWLSAYLRGRQASCCYEGIASPFRLVRAGVPQGSVLLRVGLPALGALNYVLRRRLYGSRPLSPPVGGWPTAVGSCSRRGLLG